MFDRFSRSWSLIKASASVLKANPSLLLFPLVSAIACIVVAATFIVPAATSGWLMHAFSDERGSPLAYVWAFGFYTVQYFVIIFFNTALVGAASMHLDGKQATLADGLGIARRRIGVIFGYAIIAATVGMILRAIEERAGFIGKIVVGFLGAAWTISQFMAVPVLVHRNVGPIDAVKESALLLKKTWGENLIGNGGIGLVFAFIWVGLIVVAVALGGSAIAARSAALGITFGALMVLAFVLLALIQAALQGIYSAALYRYAEDGEGTAAFDRQTLENAFRIKA